MSTHCIHRVHKGLKAYVTRQLLVHDVAVIVDVVVVELVALPACPAEDDGVARRRGGGRRLRHIVWLSLTVLSLIAMIDYVIVYSFYRMYVLNSLFYKLAGIRFESLHSDTRKIHRCTKYEEHEGIKQQIYNVKYVQMLLVIYM